MVTLSCLERVKENGNDKVTNSSSNSGSGLDLSKYSLSSISSQPLSVGFRNAIFVYPFGPD